MTTNPIDIPSYCFGIRLTAANYSTPGVTGGTFDDLVIPADKWTAAGIPVFATENGREGLTMNGTINSSVRKKIYSAREHTFVAIVRFGANSTPVFGGTNDASNTQALQAGSPYTTTISMFMNTAPTATLTGVAGSTVQVVAGAFNPITRITSAWSLDTSKTIKKIRSAAGTITQSGSTISGNIEMAVGEHRAGYGTGWVSEVHGFSVDLVEHDPTALEDLLRTLGTTVGLYP